MTDDIAEAPKRVIADLQRRLDESLAQQAATADVLKVISRSTFDLQSVLKTLITSAVKLCGANRGSIFLREGDVFPLRAASSTTPEFLQYWAANPPRAGRGSATSRVIASGKVEVIADVLTDPEMQMPVNSLNSIRGTLGVPMLRDHKVEGVLVLTRPEPGLFPQSQIDLVQTFADQAMIAIENARLFDEVQAKSADLQESLQHQTATSEVLQVISRSPGELHPVFQTILSSASTICDAQFGLLLLYESGGFRCASIFNLPSAFAETFLRNPVIYPPPIDPLGRLIASRQLVHVTDVKQEHAYLTAFPPIVELVELGGARTLLLVPMLREKDIVGVVAIFRQTVHAFSDKQIELVTSFANQAVIAIENARLLSELRERTDDLSESLQHQTATSEVLKVISRSPGELDPVFQTILASATNICTAQFGNLFVLNEDGGFRCTSTINLPPAFAETFLRQSVIYPPPIDPLGRVIATRRHVQVVDVRQEPAYLTGFRPFLELVELGGAKAILLVPMLKEDVLVGVIAIFRQTRQSFSDKQIDLVTSFANQAVIAIENARLLSELRERTDDLSESLQRQTATADILKVIASSPYDVQPVFKSIVRSAATLFAPCSATITMLKEGQMHWNASAELVATFDHERARTMYPIPFDPQRSPSAKAIIERRIVEIPDILLPETPVFTRSIGTVGGFRSITFVPLVSQATGIGTIILTHPTPGFRLSQGQLDLMQTFADQAVIAIENARLFDEVQARTKELSLSLEELRTAQDRLVQTEKLASLGQLTAGIAHEIKNPLNFVNNFSSLSGDLIDELNDLLRSLAIDDKAREEIDDLTQMLKGNLERVVQHGKRADSIVKNMLLHSREGAGEQRAADINAIVEESLNLAYHGARAEKSGFNITLSRDFDPSAGIIDLYPQEITRCF
nr:GAF domain-containing protein [Bradyrhizobium altum]